jgi:nucleolysin TIA-1/TIAR
MRRGDILLEVLRLECVSEINSWDVGCRDARVMWDQKTGRSRGFGFVSFRNQQA